MNDLVYVIVKTDFDESENRISAAKHSKILGYTHTKQEAENYIQENNYKEYRAWDDDIYPQYNILQLQLL